MATAKKAKKSNSYLARGLTAKEVHAVAAKRPIIWSPTRVSVMKALKALRATSETSAKSASDVMKRSKPKVETKKVKLHCDIYRGTELAQHGYVKSVHFEDSRELHYYLTAKGLKADLNSKN